MKEIQTDIQKSNKLMHDKKYENMIRGNSEKFKTSIFTQTFWLLWRAFLGTARDSFSIVLRIFQTFVSLIIKITRIIQ
jgi:hypothetical protein